MQIVGNVLWLARGKAVAYSGSAQRLEEASAERESEEQGKDDGQDGAIVHGDQAKGEHHTQATEPLEGTIGIVGVLKRGGEGAGKDKGQAERGDGACDD